MTARPCPYDDPNCTGEHTRVSKAGMCPSAYVRRLELQAARRRGERLPLKFDDCPYDDPNCTGDHKGNKGKAGMCPSAYRRRLGHSAVSAKAIHAMNRDRLSVIKLERGCVDCGYNKHPQALDFDHRPGTKKVRGPASMTTCSWETILAEIAKCDVRCKICHAIITAERRKEDAA